ncbi:MAG: IclR family transcriptional regulator, partial [Vulcanimicrobiaceae bacterium]
ETGRPKASIHRIISTFMNMDVVTKDKDGKYKLTFKLWGIGSAALADIDLVKVALPSIDALMAASEETAHLAVLDGPPCVTYLCKSESAHSIRVQFWVGKRVDSWKSATGRAMLAFLPEQAEALLTSSDVASDPRFDRAKFLATLAKVRRSGFAVNKGDNNPEMGGVAAPVRDHSGLVVAACGVAVPVYRMNNRLVRRCIPEVLDTALRISRDLGYVGIAPVERIAEHASSA